MLGLITLVGTVLIGILQGVVLAIALSLLKMLYRLARPHEGVLGRVPGVPGMHDVADYPDTWTLPGCMFYRYDAPLFFANIDDLRERVDKLITIENEAYPDTPVRWFVLNVEANIEIDITATDGLRQLARELADRGIHLGLARVKNDVCQPLERAGVIDVIGKEMLFATLPVAEESYLRWAEAHKPAQPTETPAQAVEDEPADNLLPWQQPDSNDEPAEGHDPDSDP
jgi:SulP family sulfate permease